MRAYLAVGAVLGVGACVSLVSPGPGGGNVPVVRGLYKNGRDQIVRIALATAATETAGVARAKEPVVIRAEGNSPYVQWNGKRYRGDLLITPTDSGLLVVNRLSMDDYLRGVVPLEIGNRTAAEFAA
ncbi:MAG: SpoIID/LytB domain-containing protein, partial [Gemmatimonadota bacterium]|nr:SpoIID/LytB domain-containing protein [Gemmatimonadota bacterium]